MLSPTESQDGLFSSVEQFGPDLTRRSVLRGAALAGIGLVGAGLAACGTRIYPTIGSPHPSPSPSLTAGPSATLAASGTLAPTATPGSTATLAPTASPTASPAGGLMPHDVEARQVIRRYIGNLAPALQGIFGDAAFIKLATVLGAAEGYPELQAKPAFAQLPQLVLNDALRPLTPTIEGGTKVFRLTMDKISQRIDELKPPVSGLGFNGQVPGPTIHVTQGDRVRAVFTNNLDESTGVHFHGVEFEDFFQDGVPWVTQAPIMPGESFAYEFTANTAGSLMYHSHHNATDQVGRGLLGAFLVDPVPAEPAVDRDYVWISNDALGGFTINGHGFPAVVPVLAAVGETVRIRFMNEGVMMHPWHSHGYRMRVVARDGAPLGSAAFDCDTLGVNPGERWDALISVDRPGIWAFHCHILPHVEGMAGMFGMVSTLIVVPQKAHVDAIIAAITQ